MPPKKSAAAAKSTALTRTGPKEVVSHPTQAKQRKEYVEKPTTTRALVLRNGKHGAMGTGELFMSNRITGKEKLDLLAGEPRLFTDVVDDETLMPVDLVSQRNSSKK